MKIMRSLLNKERLSLQPCLSHQSYGVLRNEIHQFLLFSFGNPGKLVEVYERPSAVSWFSIDWCFQPYNHSTTLKLETLSVHACLYGSIPIFLYWQAWKELKSPRRCWLWRNAFELSEEKGLTCLSGPASSPRFCEIHSSVKSPRPAWWVVFYARPKSNS